MESARKNINAKRNLTAEIDNLNEQDQDYLNRNFWKLSHDNAGTQFTACGEHYSGDERKGYLNVSGDARKGFEAETTLKNLRPGRYRVSAVVRASEAEHSNVFIFAKTGNGILCTKEIPAMGNTGGNVWFSALCRFERRAGNGDFVTALDIDKTAANGGQGFGWSRIWLDEVTVCDDDTLTYGVSTRQEITHSEQINSSWFSACDFIVERIGD